ncbi:hypothetical protein KAM329D_40470 [Aeromonas caviae]|nr:hypothetical protein KAM329_46960 [Aeromonas caviae]GJC25066.1 hypothetical protein KAM329D_40470 [Aeromonas caviae]
MSHHGEPWAGMEAGQLGLKRERTASEGEGMAGSLVPRQPEGRATGKKNGLNTRARYQIANVSVPISDADDATLSMSCWTYN